MAAPHRYDLIPDSCVNKDITSFNRKLRKLTKIQHHATILEMPNIRDLFTNHGLHLNGQGKEKLSNQIVSQIYSILDQKLDSPIILKWEKEQKSRKANIVSNELELTKDPDNKNEKDEPNTNITGNTTSAREGSESPGTNNMHMTNDSSCRTSKRQEKCPVTKSEDFLW